MKKIIYLLIVGLVSVSFLGCNNGTNMSLIYKKDIGGQKYVALSKSEVKEFIEAGKIFGELADLSVAKYVSEDGLEIIVSVFPVSDVDQWIEISTNNSKISEDETTDVYAIWKSGSYGVSISIINVSVEKGIPAEILDQYLKLYPSDLK